MKKILVTGATGNIGKVVIHHLLDSSSDIEVTAGLRDLKKSSKFEKNARLKFETVDFERAETYENTIAEFDLIFLLRPPQISDIAVFTPVIAAIKKSKSCKIVFLSVQGAEKSKIIPHNKIERLIKANQLDYIFVRPGYFMQNLTTTLHEEIKNERTITLPSGSGKFNWIDAENIGEVCARLLIQFDTYRNQAIEITGDENLNYHEVVARLNQTLGTSIQYCPVNPFKFYFIKRRQGVQHGFALVMTILHFLPRIQKAPKISNNYEKICGQKPTTLETFFLREKSHFM